VPGLFGLRHRVSSTDGFADLRQNLLGRKLVDVKEQVDVRVEIGVASTG
jgi:hypothetical protein